MIETEEIKGKVGNQETKLPYLQTREHKALQLRNFNQHKTQAQKIKPLVIMINGVEVRKNHRWKKK